MKQNVSKSDILFKIKDYLHLLSYNDVNEILNNTKQIKKSKKYLIDKYKFFICVYDQKNFVRFYQNGDIAWYSSNCKHRSNNLPAVIFNDGEKQYWKNGRRI